LLVALYACKPAGDVRLKAIVGAVLIDGQGGPPVTDSLVILSAGRIRAVSTRTAMRIPAEASKIDGAGKFLVPALVDICDRRDPPGLLRPATVEQARARVAELAAGKAPIVYLDEVEPAIADAALEAARGPGIPVAAWISTQAGARTLVDHGASALIGMIADTEALDPALLARLRDLRVVVAPALATSGSRLEVAGRNTRRLFQAGVPLGLASLGSDPVQEAELLVKAGVPPLDVIVACTRNSAMALKQLDKRGTIEPGKPAGLLLLSANPAEDVGNLRRVVPLPE
jgi:imidazolonepropionase-like amidohydrolase